MKLSINYLYEPTVAKESLEIDDIGNVSILANNDLADVWILIIITLLGVTQVIEYGPFSLDLNKNYNTSVYSSYLRFDYNEHRIEKIIDNFLNNPKRLISQASCIDEEEAKKYVKNILENLDDKYC